jgi:hypothetical protein
VSYCFNSLLVMEKFTLLSGATRNFCNVTCHKFSSLVLPFNVYAQGLR